jgi:hypothetical protein
LINTLQFVANVVDSNPILVKVSDLQDNFLDLVDLNLVPTWNSELRIVVHIVKPAHDEQVKLSNLDTQHVCLTLIVR